MKSSILWCATSCSASTLAVAAVLSLGARAPRATTAEPGANDHAFAGRARVADTTAVGLDALTVVDTVHGDTIRAAIWYPTNSAERDTTIALQALHVAPHGDYHIRGGPRPLIVVSHGTGGDQFGHWDSAEALARAGFIVATIRHAGDNSRDHTALGTDRYLYGRPTQIMALLSRLLADPVWRERIDSMRIGFFGYSAGGFTGLELLGARPRVALLTRYCVRHPRDPLYCAGAMHGRFEMTGRYTPPGRDRRIRAAALWAPTFSFLFDARTLATVRTPLLIVRALRDLPFSRRAVRSRPRRIVAITRRGVLTRLTRPGTPPTLVWCWVRIIVVGYRVRSPIPGIDDARGRSTSRKHLVPTCSSSPGA